MKKILVIMMVITRALNAGAQEWELHIAAGTGSGKLIPMGDATPASSLIHYGFNSGGIYLSPEVCLKVNDHSRFSLGYQYSESRVGIRFRPFGYGGGLDASYDILDLQTIAAGYSYRTTLGRKAHFIIGGFAKVGIAYGEIMGMGESGGSGGDPAQQGYASSATTRVSGFEVVPDFWTPTTTLGFIIGPNFQGRRVADRLMLHIAATMVWKNPYTTDSKTAYTFAQNNKIYSGIAQWQGAPLMLQVGLDYNLFHLHGKKNNG